MAWHSMTGFGTACKDLPQGRLTVSIKSLNHKGLSVVCRGNVRDLGLEAELEKCIRQKITRGRVEVEIAEERLGVLGSFDEKRLKELHAGLKSLSFELGLPLALSLAELLTFGMKVVQTDDKGFLSKEEVVEVLKRAIDSLVVSQQAEGRSLLNEIGPALEDIRSRLEGILRLYEAGREHLAKQLVQKIQELLRPDVSRNEMLTLALGYVDRHAIDEELARAKAHTLRIAEILQSERSQGLVLGFFCQELLREANTVAAKSVSAEITEHVVAIKCRIEQIREQAQNLA